MCTVNHFPICSFFFFPLMLFEIFPTCFWKTNLNQAFPEVCYIEHLRRSVIVNICKAPGENFCSRIELNDASVEPFNWWASQLLRIHKSFVFIYLIWVFHSTVELIIKIQAIKKGHRGKSNQVLVRGNRTSLLCFSWGEIWPKHT